MASLSDGQYLAASEMYSYEICLFTRNSSTPLWVYSGCIASPYIAI
ncbi:MAG TPA: hypothetical protein VMV49_00635 [Candidatus Deferrimicrobium sp.]|nr:hypothetical protein [Candidatus Deferrimicrobium sp.]